MSLKPALQLQLEPVFESLFSDILPNRDNDEVDYTHCLDFFAQKRRESYNENRDKYIQLSNMRQERKRYFISLRENEVLVARPGRALGIIRPEEN